MAGLYGILFLQLLLAAFQGNLKNFACAPELKNFPAQQVHELILFSKLCSALLTLSAKFMEYTIGQKL